jgi:hypothetical protein
MLELAWAINQAVRVPLLGTIPEAEQEVEQTSMVLMVAWQFK